MSWYYKPYVPVAERRAKAAKKVQALMKKGQKIEPVEVVHRSKIAGSFWGRSWCEHLESYSDFANRLPRGRTYVRNGSVVHLGIKPGRVEALVSGSSLYKIAIDIDPLPRDKWEAVKKRCQGKIGSLIELLQGKISGEIMAVVTDRKAGLFPGPKEIHLDCNCPDWAGLCKHLAAVLYGVGARLDTAPELLFQLRGVDHSELIAAGATDLAGVPGKGGSRRRVIATEGLGDVFGIDLDESDGRAVAEDTPLPRKPAAAGRRAGSKRPAARKAAATRPANASGRKQPATRSAKKSANGKASRAAKPAKPARAAPFRPTAAAVRALRSDLGLSRAAFAAALGVSAATVGNWENAEGPLQPQLRSLSNLRRLARTRDQAG